MPQMHYPTKYLLGGGKSKEEYEEEIVSEFKVVNRNKKRTNQQQVDRLMALTRDEDVEMEYVKVKAIMDSGAHDVVIPQQMIGGNEVRQTKRSKSGYVWHDVKGNTVRNIGETSVKGKSEDGIPLTFTAQVSDETKKLIMSVRKAAKEGNMVIFGANIDAIKKLAQLDKIEENVIVEHRSGMRSIIQDENGMYVYPMVIKRKRRSKGDPMEVGICGPEDNGKVECLVCEANEWDLF